MGSIFRKPDRLSMSAPSRDLVILLRLPTRSHIIIDSVKMLGPKHRRVATFVPVAPPCQWAGCPLRGSVLNLERWPTVLQRG